MADLMTFPDTVEEFMEGYKIVDTEQVYTNGAELVPIFRMKQWLEHAADVVPVRRGRWERKPDPYGFFDTIPVCSSCGCTTKWREEYSYCPNCGAKMEASET